MFTAAKTQFGSDYEEQVKVQFPDDIDSNDDFSSATTSREKDHDSVKKIAKFFGSVFNKRESDLDKKHIFESPDTADQSFIVESKGTKRSRNEKEKDEAKKRYESQLYL